MEPRKTKEQIPQDPVKSLELPRFFPAKSAAMAAWLRHEGSAKESSSVPEGSGERTSGPLDSMEHQWYRKWKKMNYKSRLLYGTIWNYMLLYGTFIINQYKSLYKSSGIIWYYMLLYGILVCFSNPGGLCSQ